MCGKRAEIGMVFQRFNLFPHMSVLDNVISGPVRVKKESAADGPGAGPPAARAGGAGRQGGRTTPTSCPGASSSGWPSPGPWPWNRS